MKSEDLVCEYCGRRGFRRQADYVLHLLEERGDEGIHTFELRKRFIANPSERRAELEELGHRIVSLREPLNGDAQGARYFLVPSVAAAPAAGRPVVAGTANSGPGGDGRDTEDERLTALWERAGTCFHCGHVGVRGEVCECGGKPQLGWFLEAAPSKLTRQQRAAWEDALADDQIAEAA